jgi:hypothetical protein
MWEKQNHPAKWTKTSCEKNISTNKPTRKITHFLKKKLRFFYKWSPNCNQQLHLPNWQLLFKNPNLTQGLSEPDVGSMKKPFQCLSINIQLKTGSHDQFLFIHVKIKLRIEFDNRVSIWEPQNTALYYHSTS